MEVLASLIALFETPVAKRIGVSISPEECEIWAEELTKLHIEIYKNGERF